MRVSIVCLSMLLSACARRVPPPRTAPPVQELTFTRLRGQEVSVLLVNRDLTFSGSADALRSARVAISEQLSSKGVRVIENAPRTWVLELGNVEPGGGSQQQCVSVDARLERTAQAFLPANSFSAVRCAGEGFSREGTPNLLGAFWEAGKMAVKAADGSYSKQHAAALYLAIEAALLQLDATTKY